MDIPIHQDFKGIDRFEITRVLGEGAFGTVYEAWDRERDSQVALKTLRRVDAAALYRFKREFRSLTGLIHPNLVKLYQLFSDGDLWFFTMELVTGNNFVDYVWSGPNSGSAGTHSEDVAQQVTLSLSLTEAQVERLRLALKQLAEGLVALHDIGLIHRDVKPSNVLVTGKGRVVLLDFGLVQEVRDEWLSRSFGIVGTPAYMSPEQCQGHAVSKPSDWYSVGVMLFQTLTGAQPFTGSLLEVIQKKQKDDPPAPRDLAPGIPQDLDALSGKLLSKNPKKRPSGAEVLEILGSPVVKVVHESSSDQTESFVGRTRHLESLRDAFQRTREGQATAVFVHGSSGMGKTALVRRFLQELTDVEQDLVVLAGRCHERESVPFKAVDSLVDSLSQYLNRLSPSRTAEVLPRDVPALIRLFPVLRRVEAIAGAKRRVFEIPNSVELRRRAFGALRELFARLSHERPLVLFIDDLQWGDADSGSLLIELLRPPDPPPLLLIGLYRTEDVETSPLLRKLLLENPFYSDNMKQLLVDELTPKEAQTLALALLGTEQPTVSARAKSIARESGGNPFFINELVRYGQRKLGPTTLEEVIRSRISELSEEALRLLETVAVAGRPLDLAMAVKAAELETKEEEIVDVLRVGYLVRTRTMDRGEEIEAYHDRIRETAVAQLPPEKLRSYHLQIAETLNYSGNADPETLAEHFQGGGNFKRAAEYAEIAAAASGEALAFDRASRLYQLALDLTKSQGTKRKTLQVKLGDALSNAGRGPDAAHAYLTAVAGAPTLTESIELKRRAAEQLLRSGYIDEGYSVLKDVLDTLGMRMPKTPKRALLLLLLRRFYLRLRGLNYVERDLSQLTSEELLRIDTCWVVTLVLSLVDTIRGAEFQARHLILALRAGEPYRISRALAMHASLMGSKGGRSTRHAEKVIEKSLALGLRLDHPHAIGLGTLVLGMRAYYLGQWKTSCEHLKQAEKILSEHCTGVAWELETAQIYSLVSLAYLGKINEVSKRLPFLIKGVRDRGDLYGETILRTRVAYLAYLASDDPERAKREGHQAIENWSQEGFHLQHYYALYAQIEVALYSGNREAPWELINQQWSAIKRSLLFIIQKVLIETMYLRGRSALAAALDDEVNTKRRHFFLREARRSARRIELENMPWGQPLAKLVQAGVASIQGDNEGTLSSLLSAEIGFRKADMALHEVAARRIRGVLVGGEQGLELVKGADTVMKSQGIKNPAAMTAVLVPGRWH